jgi:hypothetical protein
MNFHKPSPIKPAKEFAMARSIHPYFAPRVAKAQGFDRPLGKPGRKPGMIRSRSLAGMLLAAAVAALLAVADQLIDTWADGHLLVVWVALWTVAFTALALLAPPLRQLTGAAAALLTRWQAARVQQRSNDALWAFAQQDQRVMRDLQVASMRNESQN